MTALAATEPAPRVGHRRDCGRRRARQGHIDGRARKHAFARAGLCLDRRRGIQAGKPQVALGETVVAVPRRVGVEGYYDPPTGTFTTRDPLDGVNGTTTVANPYHYVDNDPLNKTDPLGLRAQDVDFKPPSTRYCIPKGLQGLYTPAMVRKPNCPTNVYREYLDWVKSGHMFISPDNGGFGVKGALFNVGFRRVGVSASSAGMPIVNSGDLGVTVGGASVNFQSVAGFQKFNAILDPKEGVGQFYADDPIGVSVVPGGNESPYMPADGASMQFGKKSFFNTADYFGGPALQSAAPAWYVEFFVEYLFRKYYEVDENGHTRRVSNFFIDVGIWSRQWKNADGLVQGLRWQVEPQYQS